MENKSKTLKLLVKILTFYLSLVKEAYLINFNYVDSKEVSLKTNVYDFSVDYNAIDKSNILNIHKYLMEKHSIK